MTMTTESGDTGGVLPRFTERAKQAVELAREEAGASGRNAVGTEHILLGCAPP
jgi:hypothetical protein